MEFGALEILSVTGVLFLMLCYYYGTSTFDFWQKRNVKGPKPCPFLGNFKDVFLEKIHMAELFEKFYNEFKSEPLIGIFQYKSPALLIKDPDLIKDVLIKDFNTFPDRGFRTDKKANPLSQNLINLEHERWRPLRTRLSPAFTSGKLKEMFYLMVECAEQLENYIEKLAERNEPVECRELTAKFTTQTIGLCAFGIDTHSLTDEDSEFRKQGRMLFESGFKQRCKRMLREYAPRIYVHLSPWFESNTAAKFFIDSIKDTMSFRKKNNVRRNDFIDLLMDLQSQPETFNNFELTDSLLIAQAFVLFIGGFETSSTSMSNILYELALNPDVQEKLREEIKNVIQEEDGKLTYDSIKRMKYLDKILKETLRKYAAGSVLDRITVAPYTFDKINVSIPEGTKVFIPVWAIHHDAEIYPKPEVFDPERFSEENEKTRHPMNYLPFGNGPHNCIGERFANYQVKIGIITLIHKYKVEVCDKTMIPYRLLPRPIIPTPVGGIQLKIVKV